MPAGDIFDLIKKDFSNFKYPRRSELYMHNSNWGQIQIKWKIIQRPKGDYQRMVTFPGIKLVGIADHLRRQGNNRQVCFAATKDYVACYPF